MELEAGITEKYGSNGRLRKGRPAAGEGRPVFDDLEVWLQAQLPRLSGKTKLAKAIRYALKPMPEARAYLGDGRLKLDNNICERSIRPVAPPGRKNCLFPGSVGGGEAAAIAYALIETAEMNNVDPEAWLTWVLERVADHGLTPSTNLCRGTGSPKTSKTRPDRTDTFDPILGLLKDQDIRYDVAIRKPPPRPGCHNRAQFEESFQAFVERFAPSRAEPCVCDDDAHATA